MWCTIVIRLFGPPSKQRQPASPKWWQLITFELSIISQKIPIFAKYVISSLSALILSKPFFYIHDHMSLCCRFMAISGAVATVGVLSLCPLTFLYYRITVQFLDCIWSCLLWCALKPHIMWPLSNAAVALMHHGVFLILWLTGKVWKICFTSFKWNSTVSTQMQNKIFLLYMMLKYVRSS